MSIINAAASFRLSRNENFKNKISLIKKMQSVSVSVHETIKEVTRCSGTCENTKQMLRLSIKKEVKKIQIKVYNGQIRGSSINYVVSTEAIVDPLSLLCCGFFL